MSDEKPPPLTLSDEDHIEMYDEPATLMILQPQPFVVTFHNGDQEIGRITINENKRMEFEGDMEGSALRLFEALKQMWDNYYMQSRP